MTNSETSFFSAEETSLAGQFDKSGYVILPVEDQDSLDQIRNHICAFIKNRLKIDTEDSNNDILNNIHDYVTIDNLNDFRLAVISNINDQAWFRRAYFLLARAATGALIGNELAMQRRINLSIQFPDDGSSLLPAHTDVWAGDSPYELVEWLPLVDVYKTKSMFILSPDKNREVQPQLHEFSGKGSDHLFEAIEDDVEFLDIPYGHVLLFTQTIIHGNRVNQENDTRWSMNCRLKSLFSPYADKKLGEFFEPITIRPATRIGMTYKMPGGFDGR